MSKPVRILRVVGRMNRGGLETIIMNTYRIIDRDKVQFDFVMHTEDECDYSEEIRSLGGRIYKFPRYKGSNHFKYVKVWNEFFKKHSEYNVIHGHLRSTASIYLPVAKRYGLRTIAHSHSVSSGSGIVSIIKNIMQLPIANNADYLFACSLPAGKWLFGEDVVNKCNFKVIPNGIDINKYTFNGEIRNEVKMEMKIQDKVVIGHVGRFDEYKNHGFLISIFKKINDINTNTVLMLVGEGKLKGKIMEEIKKTNITDTIIMTGCRDDVHRLLQAMDIFVFPSISEGFGNVIVEAQAAGLPCVVSNTIPREVKLTDLVEFVSLDNDADLWAKKILQRACCVERKNTVKEIFDAGYDVTSTAKWYENFYVEQHNNTFRIR